METNIIHNIDCLTGLKGLPDNSVDCCVTSPPYYGLRDYGTATWTGGDPACQHSVRKETNFEKCKQSSNRGNSKPPKGVCLKCGAIRIDNQIGLEDTPEMFIERITEVFMEVYRVLKPTGTLWLNIGDSYNGSGKNSYNNKTHLNKACLNRKTNIAGLKPKDMIGVPFMLAFALRNAGWYLRQDIIWHKPNPMPESVTDRCTKAHEYIFLMTKSAKYYFDSKAILQPIAAGTHDNNIANKNLKYSEDKNVNQWARGTAKKIHNFFPDGSPAAMKRSVWTVPTKPEKEAHFACFPQELIKDCILAGCPAGGIVLDPFMGSGTTAVAARKLNRNYIGFELSAEYCKIAQRKLRKEIGMFE